ncbi:MAG: response regulator [Gammaproteobacteria bacterium]|nr:response regulator [Gammaproteobacteria bacterium]
MSKQHDSVMESAIGAEQIRVLYSQQPLSLLGTVLVAVLAGTILWDDVDQRLLIPWLVLVIVTMLARVVNLVLFNRAAPRVADMSGWRWRAIGFALLSGLIWAALPAMFIDGNEPFTLINVVVFCVGMGAGSLAAQCVYLPVLYSFSVPLLIALPVSVHINGGEFSHFAYLGYAFGATMLGFAKGANAVFKRSIAMRFENDRLIRELKIQKAEAEAANIAKSRFLAAASHDLRQPLHAVGLYSGALRDLSESPEQHALNAKMERAIDSLDDLLGHILELSKLDAGVVQPDLQHFDMQDLVARIEERYSAIAKQRGLQYETIADDVVVESDPRLLERILDNLLSNAVQFTSDGGIQLRVVAVGSKVHVTVRDTGSGIPAAEQQNIFEEFYQLGNPERDRSKGLGLGLSIVQRLCRLLDHELDIRSAPGRGTEIVVSMAAGDREQIAAQDAESMPLNLNLADKRVMVIDDEQDVREATQAQLASWGCSVSLADSLEQAIRITDGEPAELLIVDYRLRDHESGIDAVIDYRKLFGDDIPAVLITGDTAPERIREAVDSGIQVLHKPVTPGQLRMCVNQLTSRSTRGGGTRPLRTAQ